MPPFPRRWTISYLTIVLPGAAMALREIRFDETLVDRRHAGASGRRRSADQFALDHVQQAFDARSTKRRQRPARRPPKEDGVRTQRQRLEDVAAAPIAAVGEDWNPDRK